MGGPGIESSSQSPVRVATPDVADSASKPALTENQSCVADGFLTPKIPSELVLADNMSHAGATTFPQASVCRVDDTVQAWQLAHDGPAATAKPASGSAAVADAAKAKILADRIRMKVISPELDDRGKALDNKRKAANLTEIVTARGLSPSLLAGALQQFNSVERVALHETFNALQPQHAAAVTKAFADAIDQIDRGPGQVWARVVRPWVVEFIDAHSKEISQHDKNVMIDAVNQISRHEADILKHGR